MNTHKKELTTVDYHEYPNKKPVTKAINGMDVVFSSKDCKIFQIKKKSDLKKTHAVMITWRDQNNRQNEQQIRLLVDVDHPEVFPALAIAKMVLRKARLKHDKKTPTSCLPS